MADCAQIVPVKRIKIGGMPGCGKLQVMVVDDVVPVENRPGFVSRDHHCHPFGHT